MATASKLKSLSIFFPFLNDEGTVELQIDEAFEVGNTVTDDLEVIAIIGGKSKDNTTDKIYKMQIKYPNLVIVDKSDNWEGYAVIKYGISSATKEWVFYTDGDAQYHLNDLPRLVNKQLETNADVVNGYKKARGDDFIRTFLGECYAKFSNFIFELPIRDTDCDFRLMKKKCLDKIELVSHDSSILGELIKKLELIGAKFVEIPVDHFPRVYGQSNYTPFMLFKEKFIGDLRLYFKIKKMTKDFIGIRVLKFTLVGIVSIIIQFLLFNLFITQAKMSPTLATIVSDQFAIIASFIMNNHVTFKDRNHKYTFKILPQFFKFYSIVIISTIIQALIVYTGTSIFGKSLLVSNVFFALGLVITFLWNYKMEKHLVWNTKSR